MAERRLVVARQFGLCKCGCQETVYADHGHGTQFDHEPALRLRDVSADGTDYEPPQHSVPHLDAYATKACHDKKTHGAGATTAGADTGKIKKMRKRERASEMAEKINIPSRKMRSRNSFPPRGSRPMRRK
jgi:hypothetical protein